MQESGKGRRRQGRSGDNVASSSQVKLDDNTAMHPSTSTQAHISGRLERRVLAEREQLLQSRQQELKEVLNTHDDLVREQFHLEKFVSLLYYDPQEAKHDQSNVFVQYAEKYNLLSHSSQAGPSRQTRQAQNERLTALKTQSTPDLKISSRSPEKAARTSTSAIGTKSSPKKSKLILTTDHSSRSKGKQKLSASDDEIEVETAQERIRPAKARWKGKEREQLYGRHESTRKSSRTSRFVSTPVDPRHVSSYSTRKRKALHESEGEAEQPAWASVRAQTPSRMSKGNVDFKDFSDSPRYTITIPPKSPPKQPFCSPAPSKPRPTVAGKTVSSATVHHLPKPTIKRIKLIVNEPPPLISHPAQKARPALYNKSLTTLLSSFNSPNGTKLLDESTLQRQAVQEAKLQNKIFRLRREGRLQLDTSLLGNDKDILLLQGPPPSNLQPSDIWTDIIPEVIAMKKQIASRMSGKQIAASIASKIKLYWENVAIKEDKARAAEERRLRQLAKSVLKEVVAEWKKAVFLIREEEREKIEAEERRLGRQHLDAILNQSGRILEVQQQDLLKTDSRSRTSSVMSLDYEEDHSETEVSDSDESDSSDGSERSDEEESNADDDGMSAHANEDEEPSTAELLGLLESEENPVQEIQHVDSDVAGDSDSESEAERNVIRQSFETVDDEEDEEHQDPHVNDDSSNVDGSDVDIDLITAKPDVPIIVGVTDQEHFEDFTPGAERNGSTEYDASSKDYTPSLEELSANEILAVGHYGTTQFMQVDSPPFFDSDQYSPQNDAILPTLNLSRSTPVPMDVDSEDVNEDEVVLAQSVQAETTLLAEDLERSPTPIIENDRASAKLNGFHKPVNGSPTKVNGTHVSSGVAQRPSLKKEVFMPHQDDLSDPTGKEVSASKGVQIKANGENSEEIGSNAVEVNGEAAPDVTDSKSGEENENGFAEIHEREQTPDPTWEAPPHLKPFAVAQVDYDLNAPVKPPILLRGNLRPYQQSGLEWLVSLHNNNMNGILADEMGLGKTIQTIALLGHLACERGIWGPHLIIVPTSVILNWEMEFKKFLPGFKVLSYHGTVKRRQELRKGWNNKYAFNVLVTSYSLASRDAAMFKRKSWYYMILDEAHMIKNFKSQRWNILLLFKSYRRLLLTGTPLQNNLTELWALLQFLMSGANFANLKDFGEWFSNPLEKAIEQGTVMDEEVQQRVTKLHTVLRPYLLRRLKRDVEKELPSKYDHLVLCRLSKRQRFLYDEFMSRGQTREDLQSGIYQKIANILMQLRKVCNHPDLFEVRPIVTSFAMGRSPIADFEIKELLIRRRMFEDVDKSSQMSLDVLGLRFSHLSNTPFIPLSSCRVLEHKLLDEINASRPTEVPEKDLWTIEGYKRYRAYQLMESRHTRYLYWQYINHLRCNQTPVYGLETIQIVRKMYRPLRPDMEDRLAPLDSPRLLSALIKSNETRAEDMSDIIDKFAFATPKAVARNLPSIALREVPDGLLDANDAHFDAVLHRACVKLQIAFPDLSLLEYDCGKLRELASLLRERKAGGHRVLIFTQMTRVLDILELFLNYHGYLYLRLDGATKIEDRQYITERFNVDDRIFAFISSSRSGGVGVNLTGADTVIFYDSDFNPQMDRQCEDRAHRIGQIRDVHIYRFISQYTVEEAMLRKANQKRSLDDLVIQQGDFDWKSFFHNVESVHSSSALQKALVEFEDFEDVRAADVAEKEEAAIEDENQADFGDDDGPCEGETTGISTGLNVNEEDNPDDGAESTEHGVDEEEGGSLADYMISMVRRDWEFFRDWKL